MQIRQPLGDRTASADAAIQQLRCELAQAKQAVSAMRNSWSWRLTSPIRWVSCILLAVWRLLRTPNAIRTLAQSLHRLAQFFWFREVVHASGLFDEQYYLATNVDVPRSASTALRHFFLFGAAEGRKPHPLFDPRYYLEQYSDVTSSGINPLLHYVKWGAREGRNPHRAFDTTYYIGNYAEVRDSGMNPLVHYLGPGTAAGLNPSATFDTIDYLERHPEAARAGVNPLIHHVMHEGAQEVDPPRRPVMGISSGLPRGMRIDPRETTLRRRLREQHAALRLPPLLSNYHSIPLVSVIIPCYEYGYYLEDAVLSASMACSSAMEVIVVDDGSIDPTSILESRHVAERYNIQLIRQPHTGQNGARLNGLMHSSGRFIQFLDADDLLAPGKIDVQLQVMASDVDIAVCEYELCDADGEGGRRPKPSTLAGYSFSREDFLLHWERGFSLPIHTALFRRDTLHSEHFPCVTQAGKEDWLFWIAVAAQQPRFRFHPDVLATYRMHDHNTALSRERMGLDYLRACMYVMQTGLNSTDDFPQKSIEHFEQTYLPLIKSEAIATSIQRGK